MAIKINLDKTVIMRIEDDNTGVISFNGGVFAINEISVLVFKGLSEKKSILEIAKNIMDTYEVDINDLKEDLNQFFSQLLSMTIITNDYMNRTIEELDTLCTE